MTNKTDEEILKIRAAFLVATLLLFRHYHDEAYLIEHTEIILESIKKVDKASPKWAMVEALLNYFLANVANTTQNIQIVHEKIENIMRYEKTLYDVMVLEPLMAAKAEAEAEKKLMVEGLWEDGFPMEKIGKLTRLTEERVLEMMQEIAEK